MDQIGYVLTSINEWQPNRRYTFDIKQEKEWHPDIIEDDFWKRLPSMWDYSCCSTLPLYNFYTAIKYVLDNNVEGDIIECGVFFGGTVMMAAQLLKDLDFFGTRKLYALDTFTGFVRNTPGLDVDYAGNFVCEISDTQDEGFLTVSSNNMRSIGFSRLEIVPGDVLDTLPELPVQQVAILRLDTDTYDTTKIELEQMYDKVSRGGVIIIDDYGFTLGCRKAVDEFVAGKLLYPIRVDRFCRAFVKTA